MGQSMGMMLDYLEDPNDDSNMADSLRDDTIILFGSDNGGVWEADVNATANLPMREGKGSFYEGGIREPFIASWTGNANIAPSTQSDARTPFYDLYPTVLDLTGLDADV